MKKDTLIKTADITTDMIGAFCPPLAAAKALLLGSKDLIFKEEVENLDPKKLKKMLENENFVHLLLQVQDACRRSKEDEKARLFTKFFKTIVENGKFDKTDSDEIEEFIYILSNFSYREILALHKIREFTHQNPELVKKAKTFTMLQESDYKDKWNIVLEFIKNKLNVTEIEAFLSRLSNSKLIIKNKNEGGIYFSTSYFERLYQLSDEMDNYLD